MEVGTPLTFQHYLRTSQGEIYGLDHTTARFNAKNAAHLRPKTPINGLYLTGQVRSGLAGHENMARLLGRVWFIRARVVSFECVSRPY